MSNVSQKKRKFTSKIDYEDIHPMVAIRRVTVGIREVESLVKKSKEEFRTGRYGPSWNVLAKARKLALEVLTKMEDYGLVEK